MRRKTKIILAITFMVVVMVSAFSYLYISQLLRQRLTSAGDIAQLLAQQLVYSASNAVPDLGSTRIDTDNSKSVQLAIEGYLKTDTNLNDMLDSSVGNVQIVYDAAIVDPAGRAMLHSNSDLDGKILTPRPNFEKLRGARFRDQLRMIYSPSAVYDVTVPLQLNGTPFGTVRVGISTVLLRNELTPRLEHALYFSGASIFLSLLLAALISRLALGPLEEINRNLDYATGGSIDEDAESDHDEYGLVTLKIANLGRQVRDAKEIFSALKDNVDQLMANLQDGLMLFTREYHVVLVSASVERFLGRPRGEMLGRSAKDVFQAGTPLNAVLLDAFERRRPLMQREIESANGRRVQVSLDFIQDKSTQIGALLIIRDTESVRRLEDEIEMSRRLSASGRLTRGVAHEVKNPINAIVLHLHLLQNKLQQMDPGTRRHVDIIGSEIHRLDRVVQILVDFTRPRDLKLEEVDLRRLLEEVAALAAPDAEQHAVAIVRNLPERSPDCESRPRLHEAGHSQHRDQRRAGHDARAASSRSARAATKAWWSSRCKTRARESLAKHRKKSSNFTSRPKKAAAASAWLRPTRSCSGTTAQSILKRSKAKARSSVSAYRWLNPLWMLLARWLLALVRHPCRIAAVLEYTYSESAACTRKTPLLMSEPL